MDDWNFSGRNSGSRDFGGSGFDGSESLEALIRSARDYVRPTDDLRPRVLETAQIKRWERQAMRQFWLAAAVVLVFGGLTGWWAARQDAGGANYPTVTAAGNFVAPAEVVEAASDASWQFVDSFTQLRSHQAALLRM